MVQMKDVQHPSSRPTASSNHPGCIPSQTPLAGVLALGPDHHADAVEVGGERGHPRHPIHAGPGGVQANAAAVPARRCQVELSQRSQSAPQSVEDPGVLGAVRKEAACGRAGTSFPANCISPSSHQPSGTIFASFDPAVSRETTHPQ